MNWENISTDLIIGGVTPDGVRYLQLFLSDYSKEFKLNSVASGCRNCIADYHKKYTIRMKAKNNECEYRLHEKYNGIQVEPCSSIFVNNGNITNETALLLLASKGARVFAKMPTTTQTIVEPTDAPKLKRTRTKKQ